jgi:hypothetical protein
VLLLVRRRRLRAVLLLVLLLVQVRQAADGDSSRHSRCDQWVRPAQV